jgi:hypothetical protein
MKDLTTDEMRSFADQLRFYADRLDGVKKSSAPEKLKQSMESGEAGKDYKKKMAASQMKMMFAGK